MQQNGIVAVRGVARLPVVRGSGSNRFTLEVLESEAFGLEIVDVRGAIGRKETILVRPRAVGSEVEADFDRARADRVVPVDDRGSGSVPPRWHATVDFSPAQIAAAISGVFEGGAVVAGFGVVPNRERDIQVGGRATSDGETGLGAPVLVPAVSVAGQRQVAASNGIGTGARAAPERFCPRHRPERQA